ncbi:MAG: hypothetical protein KA004_15285 [Verrucomicrobiales bacterium]|nr:hypothetical protein [Verrucomicrobiales bacterium]
MKTTLILLLITAFTVRAGIVSDPLGLVSDPLGMESDPFGIAGPPVNQGIATDALGLQGGTLYYRAAPGAVNTVTVTTQNGRVVLTDATAPLPPCLPIPGLVRPNPHTISLPAACVGAVSADLGDGNDAFHAVGFPGSVLIAGGLGNDTIVGGGDADFLHGNDGDDTLWGGGGTDEICGGNGNDSIVGGGDADFLHGNDGDDTLWGGGGTDEICGGNGNDSLYGDTIPDESITGDAGNDCIIVTSTNICGGMDDDQLILPFLHGGAGQDLLSIEGRGVSPAREAELLQLLPPFSIEILEIAAE